MRHVAMTAMPTASQTTFIASLIACRLHQAAQIFRSGLASLSMGRFPVTLYKEQWLKLLDMSTDIRAFIAANEAQLKTKD